MPSRIMDALSASQVENAPGNKRRVDAIWSGQLYGLNSLEYNRRCRCHVGQNTFWKLTETRTRNILNTKCQELPSAEPGLKSRLPLIS